MLVHLQTVCHFSPFLRHFTTQAYLRVMAAQKSANC